MALRAVLEKSKRAWSAVFHRPGHGLGETERLGHSRTTGRLAVVLFYLAGINALASTIRHDVMDSSYTSFSADRRFEASGAISYFATSNPGNVLYCSGTLIHPEWVLTAAHCTINLPNWNYTFLRGPDRSNPTSSISVNLKNPNPGFNTNAFELGGDFGLLRLSTPVLDVTPARIYRASSELNQVATVLGYGRTGTGITGENAGLPNGIRRALDNRVDAFGGTFGFSSKLMATDFDNPSNALDNQIGSATPLALEGNVALNDSGGGWFQTLGGVSYLSGVTSFRASNDGLDNSDYGDFSFGGRVGQDLVWIDGNYDRTLFWNAASGDWNTDASWYGGIEPTAISAAVINSGTVSVTNVGETAEYVFLESAATLNLQNSLQTSLLRMRDTARLTLGSTVSQVTVAGVLNQLSGTIAFDIQGTGATQYDQLSVAGSANLQGGLEIDALASYTGPATRGATDSFVLLNASSITGTPSSLRYENVFVAPGVATYVGDTLGGVDGLFVEVEILGTTVELSNYLALPGDANGDRVVDGSDFGIWNTNKFMIGTNWTTGDFSGDGVTDGTDFGIWNANKFTTATATSVRVVPEPVGGLVILVAMLLIRWH